MQVEVTACLQLYAFISSWETDAGKWTATNKWSLNLDACQALIELRISLLLNISHTYMMVFSTSTSNIVNFLPPKYKPISFDVFILLWKNFSVSIQESSTQYYWTRWVLCFLKHKYDHSNGPSFLPLVKFLANLSLS